MDPRNSGTREVPACHEVRPLNGCAIGPVSITEASLFWSEGWGVDWNGQLGLVQLGDGGETHGDEGKQLRLVQLGDGGGNSWVMRENLPKV